MSLHALLDGILANNDTELKKKVEYYWFSLQLYILRFRSRIIHAKEIGDLKIIPDIQAEFDNEMRFIILDMENTLNGLNAPRKTIERMIGTVTKIRKELFGNTSKD